MRILIVDDAEGIRTSLMELLKDEHHVLTAHDAEAALQTLNENAIDLVITDNHMNHLSGVELVHRGKAQFPRTRFVLMTAFETVEEGLEALRSGADDVFRKPFELMEVLHRIERIDQLRQWESFSLGLRTHQAEEKLVGGSTFHRQALDFIAKVAADTRPVLFAGRLGVGKSRIAHEVHRASARAARPFTVVPCTSELDLEAVCDRGCGGTILFQWVERMPETNRLNFSELLEKGEFRAKGRRVVCDARVVATSLVESPPLRGFSFHHILGIPPLSERKEDIPELIAYFVQRLGARYGRAVTLSEAERQTLARETYPANVASLRNAVDRLVLSKELLTFSGGDADTLARKRGAA